MLMVRSFTDLPLTPASLDAIAAAGYATPTPIQARAIPPILDGSDLIGCAQTGTGKTAASAIPTIERLTGAGARPLGRAGSGPRALVRRHLVRPARIEAGLVARPVAGVTQVLYRADAQRKTPLLLKLLGAERGRTLIFTRTKHRADRVARAVTAAGHRAARLHADRSMSERREALNGFRSGRYRVLIATDIAARGIDVPEIAHVVNFDLPGTPEDYIHRIGRTARAEASGVASSFAAPEEQDRLRAIERHLGHPLVAG